MSELVHGNEQHGRAVRVAMRTPREKFLDPLANPRPRLASMNSGREIKAEMSTRPVLSKMGSAPELRAVSNSVDRPGLSRD